MKVLVANDDGINARGIKELVGALSEVAEVYVFAPESQRSAFSHAITTSQPIRGRQVEFEGAVLAFETTGTPADCVKVGTRLLRARGIEIDMVFSGINSGSNLGTDTLYSGTVGAAIEGNICGVPAVAVSVDTHEATHFEYAKKLAVAALQKAAGRMPSNMVLNINVPNVPEEEVKGVKYTVLGDRDYDESFSETEANGNEFSYMYGGAPLMYEGLPDTIDVIASQKGYATITPLQRDLTYYGKVEEIKNWGIDE
ncbi:MAG: 5'/3'-nucleotidase SurE [Eubacterium sp.]|nr:5'/3'-nucleotidase SurE [Candidatus Colimonas fimequi]